MARAPRLEFSGALYHVTARGVHQAPIFLDEVDRVVMLRILVQALRDFDARLFAFCLMGNHYHLVIQTWKPNLSMVMHRINSTYCRSFNQSHGRRGHVFEGRFKAVLVDRDNYLLQACRYVDLNPVRARLIDSPGLWRWSSYRAHAGLIASPLWLATSELHAVLVGKEATDASQAEAASRSYAEWVEAGRGFRLWTNTLRRGRFLGDEAFVSRMKLRMTS